MGLERFRQPITLDSRHVNEKRDHNHGRSRYQNRRRNHIKKKWCQITSGNDHHNSRGNNGRGHLISNDKTRPALGPAIYGLPLL